MKQQLKQEKGVTLVALGIAIIVLVILTNLILYNTNDSMYIKRLESLTNDLQNLRDKVSDFYNQYGKIPATVEYTNVDQLRNVLSTKNDTGKFYVIDLQAIPNVTLNYGKDYEQIKQIQEKASQNNTSINQAEVNGYTDLYIINENSHHIFYVKGVEIKEKDAQTKQNIMKFYYTDQQKPDETTVDLRYVDGVKIPDGYYYLGKENKDGEELMVISSQKDETINHTSIHQYVWIEQLNSINQLPENISLNEEQTKQAFIQSVNVYHGYYKNKNQSSSVEVIYFPVTENKWSAVYTETAKYTDKNGEQAYVPKGFYVSLAEGTNEIKNGLVITDGVDEKGNSTGNEFVWIPVQEEQYVRNTEYERTYISEKAYTDIGYLPTTITPSEENSTNNEAKEKEQIEKYGGFYLGRYETGQANLTNVSEKTGELLVEQTPISQKNKVVYNYIAQENAKKVARKMYDTNEVKSALCSGIQWDLAMGFVHQKIDGKGNKYNVVTPQHSSQEFSRHTGTKAKTGQNEADRVCNLYDLEGNFLEYIAERNTHYPSYSYVGRGGIFTYGDTINSSASYRTDGSNGEAMEVATFRAVLYLLSKE